MNRARYIGKSYGTGYERDIVILEYEYRGYRYEVYENRAKGYTPLAWQHRNEQIHIDQMIEQAERSEHFNTESAQVGLDKFFDYLDGNENAFEEA